jgi:DNA-binding MarR family transcriptional regulator
LRCHSAVTRMLTTGNDQNGARMANTGASDVPGRLAYIAGRLGRRMRSSGTAASPGLLSALTTVQRHGPIRLADLARHELISAPSTTRLVAELENRGLISRRIDPGDGRAFLIAITAAGEAEVGQTRAAHARLVEEMLSVLSAQEAAALEAALPALERAVERSLKADGGMRSDG